MKKYNLLLCISVLLLGLSGCASVSKQSTDEHFKPEGAPEGISQKANLKNDAPQNELPLGDAQQNTPATPLTEGANGESVNKSGISRNRAVIALLDRAKLDTNTGQREAASASLERALRIEPRNPWLWHELAKLRQAQGNYAQAISLAQKSSSFARNDRRLQALNWRVIGNARVAQGNALAAEQAFKYAVALEQ